MKKRLLSATLLSIASLAIAVTAQAQDKFTDMPSGVYILDDTHASLTWQVSHLGLSNYTARFTDIDAEINFNPENISESMVTAKINPTSLKTDYPYPEKKDFDKKLVEGKDWFNSIEFPSINFKSTNIKMTGEKTAIMKGDLTFLGITTPVELDVTFNGAYKEKPFSAKPALGFSAVGSLNRSGWGMDTYIPTIGDNVKLIIETEFEKKIPLVQVNP
jgi:polyisoprenoid-binding protein YceI